MPPRRYTRKYGRSTRRAYRTRRSALSRYVPGTRTVTSSSRRVATMRLPGFARFQLTWTGTGAIKTAANGTTWSAANFPGFNGIAATYDEYRIKSITYRVRSEFNSIYGPGVQEDQGGNAPIYIDPVMVVADLKNNLPATVDITDYTPQTLLSWSNAELFRGTRYSKWRTVYPRVQNATNVPVTANPQINTGGIIDAKQWQPTSLPGIQHVPLTMVASEDVEVNSAIDPQSRYPQFIIEAYAQFEFRSAR